MSLIYGHEVKEVQRVVSPIKYMLEYLPTTLSIPLNPVRTPSGGYRYISMEGFSNNTYITLMTHSFGTNTGKNMVNCIMKYTMGLTHNNGKEEFFSLGETINLRNRKVPKPGSKHNVFLLNKRYNIAYQTNNIILSNFTVLSLLITQISGTLSNDTSTLDVLIEV